MKISNKDITDSLHQILDAIEVVVRNKHKVGQFKLLHREFVVLDKEVAYEVIPED